MAEKRAADFERSPSKRPKLADTNGDASAVAAPAPDQQEQAVGIFAFVSPETPGFQCTVKQRYTDFLVNEIIPSGEVLHLVKATPLPGAKQKVKNGVQDAKPTNSENVESAAVPAVQLPEASQSQPAQPEQNGQSSNQDANGDLPKPEPEPTQEASIPELSTVDKQTMHDIFGEETTEKIVALYAAVLKRPSRKPRDHNTVRSEIISDKSKRTEAHGAVRRIFDSKLQTETVQNTPGVIMAKAAPTMGPGGGRTRLHGTDSNGAGTKGKMGWKELGGEYLHFTLYKENKDTMEVLHFMATQLKVPAKTFQFAGTKDRRGVTVQKVAIFRMYANRIAALNRMAKGWVASGFEYKEHGLELGQLLGNEFLLTLRDCRFNGEDGLDSQKRLELAKEAVAVTASSFKAKGFLNYYGLQRFGTFSTGTHMVGMKMLQGDLEGAVNSILTYSTDSLPEHQPPDSRVPVDDTNRADAICRWRESGEAGHDFASRMPKRFQAESAMIHYLSKKHRVTGKPIQEKDWQGALMQIQHGLRLMYVHAYQSLVWNVAASKRWEMFGDQITEGDLIIVGEKNDDADVAPKEEVDEDGEPIVRPAEEDSAPSAESKFTRAHHLTKAEAESGKYDIFDVVLPQPGYDIAYPVGPLGKLYEDFMGSEEGGKMDPHNMRRTWKDISLSGAYRKMMGRPLGGLVECEVREYISEDEQMVETDKERIERERVKKEGEEESVNGSAKVEGGEDGEKKLAVVMKFQLASSQYATMALRELTKGGAGAYKPDFSAVR
ncbi:hypothetical protein LTR08_006408 [Meristemomyces frigidus]|nr:hypothetical protein LTR08_006408 [Meristemomyces frigidus]